MVFVEFYDRDLKTLVLSKIPLWVFIGGLFTGEASLLRWHIKGKAFAYFVPPWAIIYD